MSYNILLCGVGGQGTVLASKLLAATAGGAGLCVHSAETIGMAQRGGPVTSHVRIGEDAYSPLIPKGGADLIIAFEPAEAVRNLDYLKKDGAVIVNENCIRPVTESLNPTGYDGTEMLEYLKRKIGRLITVNADSLCESLGSSKFFNVAVLGVAQGARLLDFSEEEILSTIENTVKEDFVKINKKAFLLGRETGMKEAGIGMFAKGKEDAFDLSEENKPAGVSRHLTKEEAEKLLSVRIEVRKKNHKA